MPEAAVLWGEPPTVLFDLASALLEAAELRLAEAGRLPARVCVYPGDIPDEIGDCEMLAASFTTIALSKTFPVVDVAAVDCASWQGIADLYVILVRCVPGLDDHGLPPEGKALTEASRAFYSDVWRVWAGILCAAKAWADDTEIGDDRSVVVRGGEITGPLGGVVRATFRLGVSVSA